MFNDVNEKVGAIAAEVGKTPQQWNASVFSIIQTLSENVILPIAGLIITFILCYELITMITEKNNMHDIDTFMFFKGGLLRGNPANHYPVMTVEEICELPVPKFAADNCVLFMWATFPKLKEAFEVIKAWGFKYSTVAFVWVKKNKKSDSWFMGMGWWTRNNAEVCLVATRGHPKRISRKVHQLIISPVEEHSKKPDITRDKIIELMGDLPRVELFARQAPPGWDVWGNEVLNDVWIE